MSKSIGENIARLRKQRGMTQEELAERMSISGQAVSKWENDLSYPDIETLGRLTELFDVSLDELVNGLPAAPTVKSAEPEKVDRRTLTTTVETGKTNIKLRLPVALVKLAAESEELGEILDDEETANMVRQIMPLINEGAVGELVNADTDDVKVRIAVEDYEG